MYLKKLEISGFKSFAKNTTLEFPSRVTGIVGPNGSGKSNIKEAIQWVLGEQSMKSLRAKLGEDLIWNGSAQVPRMGKASVTLFFDNKDGRIPIDFEEVSIARKIFRDGLNEYYLNGSQVRLKDVVELMARMGLGESKHNIIGQGEVDRILLATIKDRRAMLEEALGLRVYQLKKNETERKLTATENNMQQVQALVREIAPHLRFLRTQAQKAQARESVESELKQLQVIYFSKEKREIDESASKLVAQSAPLLEKRIDVKQEIERLSQNVREAEKAFANDESSKSGEEKQLIGYEAKRRELEREIGRLEGRLEVEKERLAHPAIRVVDSRYIQESIREYMAEVRRMITENSIESIRAHLHTLVQNLEVLTKEIQQGSVEEKPHATQSAVAQELEKTIQSLQEELAVVTQEVEKLELIQVQMREKHKVFQLKIRELDLLLRAKQDEDRDITVGLERFRFDEERIKIRELVLRREMEENGFNYENVAHVSVQGYETIANEEIRRKIERLKGKLEEIGGIDVSVIKEFSETETRHEFLTKELEDLEQASRSLKELVKELDDRIRHDFKEGFSKIKEEFQHLFRIIFGGGKASLQILEAKKRKEKEPTDMVEEEETEAEEGVDIAVELPGKRIKGLAMLSGGERALTSIALLFAITAVNPPPFLILDETDAALDEANSQRYGAIIKELAKKTQLLIVTHNRETMKSAGVLYGVTMGDEGVSKLLSLKFEEAEEYTNR